LCSPQHGLAVSSRMDLHSIWIMHHIKRVEYVELDVSCIIMSVTVQLWMLGMFGYVNEN